MAVVIASAVRTAITSFQGGFTSLSAPQLGAAVVRAALERAGVAAGEVDLVMLGQVLAAGAGQAPARQAARDAGLPDRVPAVTVNKMCGSGLETVIQGARAIALGDASVVVAGGMESMTNAPYLLMTARGGLRLGDGEVVDSILRDGLVDAYDGRHMGTCAEWCATTHGLSRVAQDDYAARSYRRAQHATAAGIAGREIVPVEVTGRKGAVTTVDTDEGPARVDFDKLPTLRPAFEQTGTVTAGNASSLNDGAAALVIADEAVAAANGWPVLATIRGYAVHAQAPAEFTTAPIGAMHALYARTGWKPTRSTPTRSTRRSPSSPWPRWPPSASMPSGSTSSAAPWRSVTRSAPPAPASSSPCSTRWRSSAAAAGWRASASAAARRWRWRSSGREGPRAGPRATGAAGPVGRPGRGRRNPDLRVDARRHAAHLNRLGHRLG